MANEGLHTTLALFRKCYSASDGRYDLLLQKMGAGWPENKPISLLDLLDLDLGAKWNGIHIVFWAFRAVPDHQSKERDRVARLFACDCASHVLHLFEKMFPNDSRPGEAIKISRLFAEGKTNRESLEVATDSAQGAICRNIEVEMFSARAAAAAAYWAANGAADGAADCAAEAKTAELIAAWVAETNRDAEYVARKPNEAAERSWQKERLRDILGQPIN
jgi:hypothetical protein